MAAWSGTEGADVTSLALLLERRFRLPAQSTTLCSASSLIQPTASLRAAGKLNGGGREQIDHRQREGDGAIELGGDLRPWQPQWSSIASLQSGSMSRKLSAPPGGGWNWPMRDGEGC